MRELVQIVTPSRTRNIWCMCWVVYRYQKLTLLGHRPMRHPHMFMTSKSSRTDLPQPCRLEKPSQLWCAKDFQQKPRMTPTSTSVWNANDYRVRFQRSGQSNVGRVNVKKARIRGSITSRRDPMLEHADRSEMRTKEMAMILTSMGVTPVISMVVEIFHWIRFDTNLERTLAATT